MNFRFDKLTIKAQEAVTEAQQNAGAQGHPEIDSLHLLAVMLNGSDGIVTPIFDKIGVQRQQLVSMVKSELERLSQVSGGTAPQPNDSLNKVLPAAADEAAQMQDEYNSTEHQLIAIAKVDSKARKVLQLNAVSSEEIMAALVEIRGSSRVTDQNPEEKKNNIIKNNVIIMTCMK